MTSISENFGNLGITISNRQIEEMERLAVHFVLRRTHPLTFNGRYLGCDPVSFTDSDKNALFDIFKIKKQDVELQIRATPSIDRNFIVTSDPFNLLSIWLVHLAPIFIKDKRVCREFMLNVLRYYHYKIFTSVVNNSFRHGTNRGIVEATIASLSYKSDIIRYESWKLLIDSHCEKMIDPEDRFYQTIVDGSPDEAFLRVVSESQTALRAKIVTFAGSYYEAHKAGNSVGSRSAIGENADGERIIAQSASVIDSATQAMVSEILNPNMFVHEISVNDVARMFMTISPRMLKTALLKINETAVLQTSSTKSKQFDEVRTDKDGTLYIGVRVLVIEIIRSMVRTARENRINMANRLQIFDTMRKAYSSSRNLDPDIVAIKRSVTVLTDPFNITTNDASRSALRLAIIYYLLYRMIQKMK
jgi:hypothetical protein